MGAFDNPAKAHQAGNERIHYNISFKLCEITRFKNGAKVWFEWMENSQYHMRRVKVNIKVLRWLVAIFIEASKIQGRIVERWSVKNHFAKFYSTFIYNEIGRYIIFISIQGMSRSIIITPETSNKGCWIFNIASLNYEPTRVYRTNKLEKLQQQKSYKKVANVADG